MSAGAELKTVCNRARVLTRNSMLLSRARGSARYGTAVDLPFPLPSPAIATAREELLRHAGRARQLRACAKVHPGCARARYSPTRLRGHRTAETSHLAERTPTLAPICRQAAAGNARRSRHISSCAAAEAGLPSLPFANVCEAQHQRSASPARPD